MTKVTHGGKRPGAGRKRGSEPRDKVCILLSKAEHAKLRALGGSAWVRAQLAKTASKDAEQNQM